LFQTSSAEVSSLLSWVCWETIRSDDDTTDADTRAFLFHSLASRGIALIRRLSFIHKLRCFQVPKFTFMPTTDAAAVIADKLDIYDTSGKIFAIEGIYVLLGLFSGNWRSSPFRSLVDLSSSGFCLRVRISSVGYAAINLIILLVNLGRGIWHFHLIIDSLILFTLKSHFS
uniref:Uncharacterized protein n=1 Tax=Parascaris equorum TaxID=6256 RepID=A0A914S0C0_PAREQ